MNKWLAVLGMAGLLGMQTGSALAADPPLSPDSPRKEIKEDGFELPKKGPLVSELREQMGEEAPGMETVVRIYEDLAGNQVRESMVNGAVYKIDVTPVHGISYILMDNDGDGLFETRFHGYEQRLVVPQWVVFRF